MLKNPHVHLFERDRELLKNSREKILRENLLINLFYSPCLFLQQSLIFSFWWRTPRECPLTVIPFCKLKRKKNVLVRFGGLTAMGITSPYLESLLREMCL